MKIHEAAEYQIIWNAFQHSAPKAKAMVAINRKSLVAVDVIILTLLLQLIQGFKCHVSLNKFMFQHSTSEVKVTITNN